MNKLCLIDWDGTLRKGYTSYDWLLFLESKGFISRDYSLLFKELIDQHKKQEIIYEDLVIKTAGIVAKSLKGKCLDEIKIITKEFVRRDNKLFAFTTPLLKKLKEKNIQVAIISGAPEIILDEYNKIYNFNFNFIKSLKFKVDESNLFTGGLEKNYGLASEKEDAILSIKKQGEVNILFSLGNAISDIPLFKNSKYAYIISAESENFGNKIYPVSPNEVLSKIINKINHEEKN